MGVVACIRHNFTKWWPNSFHIRQWALLQIYMYIVEALQVVSVASKYNVHIYVEALGKE